MILKLTRPYRFMSLFCGFGVALFILLGVKGAAAAYNYESYPWTDTGEKLWAYAAVNKTSFHANARALYPKFRQYAPYIHSVASEHKVPLEVVVLAAIESGFDSNAKSPAGAVGMWQFMKPTARDYGLQINKRIDERLDWKKSTVAAIKYIKWLAEIRFGGDYETAVMAYNFGVGNMEKVIRKAKTSDAWVLINANMVPLETEEHLLKFLIYIQMFRHLDSQG